MPFKKYKIMMCGSRNFFTWGSRSDGQKTVWTFFFFYLVLYLITVYRGGPIVLLHRKLYFSKDPEGVQHFPVGNYFQWGGGGVHMLSSIETHITCNFPGGSGPPNPPPPPLCIRTWLYFFQILKNNFKKYVCLPWSAIWNTLIFFIWPQKKLLIIIIIIIYFITSSEFNAYQM